MRTMKVETAGAVLETLTIDQEKSDSVLLVIPGLSATAEQMSEGFDHARLPNVIIATMRGRKGSALKAGATLTLEEHADDIQTLIDGIETDFLVIHSYSVGTAYLLKALRRPSTMKRVQGVIIGDYPPRYERYGDSWPDWFSKLNIGGTNVSSSMTKDSLAQLQRDSKNEDLSSVLQEYSGSILLQSSIGGKGIPSPLSPDDLATYKRASKSVHVVEFSSGHLYRIQENEKYILSIIDFIDYLKREHWSCHR